MSEWQPIETAPRETGAEFLAAQAGEIYHVRVYNNPGWQLAFRTHARRCPRHTREIDAVMDGKPVKASVLIDEGPETFEHNWTYWTRGFEFEPTLWAPLPSPGRSSSDAGG